MPTDKKLTALDAVSSVDYIYGESSGVSKKITPANIVSGHEGISDSGWVDISSVDLLATTTPKVIVPAPGGNKIIAIIEMHLFFSAGNIAYTQTGAGTYAFYYAGATFDTEALGDFGEIILQTTDQYGWALTAQESFPYLPAVKIIDKAVVLSINPASTPFTNGNGTARARAFYHLLDLS